MPGHVAEVTATRAEAEARLEGWFRRGDGSKFRGEVVVSPVGEGRVQLLLRDLLGRSAASRAARAARERLRLVAEAAGFGTYVIDPSRVGVEWSPQLHEITGLPVSAPLDRHTLAALVHPDDRDRVARVLCGAAEASGADEFRVVRPDGEVRWLRHTCRSTRADRGPDGLGARVIGTVLDLTEQRRTEEALRRSEARFRQALRGSPVVVATQDRDLRYTWVHSPGLSTVEERLGRSDADLLAEADAARVTRVKRAVLETGLPAREEVRNTGADGVRDLQLSVEPLKDEGGEVGGVSVVEIDLTERHRTATALKESEERLRLAMQGARMFSFDSDLLTGVQQISANAAKVLGYEVLPEAFEDRVTWSSVVHPDDLPKVRLAHVRLLEAGEGSAEYRVRSGDGYRWLAVHRTLVRDRAGVPLRIIGMAQDVTERKRAEQAARARELAALARLQAIAMRAVEDDLSGLFDEIVDAAIAITGADMGVLQVRDRGGELEIVAQRGFEPRLEPVMASDRGPASMGSLAVAHGGRVVVEDLTRGHASLSAPDLRALLAAGVRAAQATPLATRSGDILGTLSVHYRSPRPCDEQDLPTLNLLARLSADLLEQRRLMDDLRAADRRNREFLAAVAEPVVIIDQRGRIAYANGQAEKVFGYGPGELDGQPHALLLPERLRLLHVLHTKRLVSSERRTRALSPELPLYGRRKDGTEFPIEVSVNPITTASGTMVSTVVRDVGERRRLEAAAQLHAERLASAIESIPDPIAVWDTADRLAACNSAFRELVTTVVPGPFLGSLVGADLDARVAEALVAPDEDPRGTFSRVPSADLHFRDGRRLRVSTREMPGGGRVTVAIDLTEDLRQKHDLEVARADAEAASRAKSEFLASMSHELRTPLNAVLGFCQLLQRDRKEPLTERQREMVDLAYRGGEHLLHLIDDALDLARIEANRVSMDLQPMSVLDAIGDTVDALEPTASEAGVALLFEPPATEPPPVDADARRLVQILMNYGSNAVKYNRRGGCVAFHVTRPRPGVVRVTVEDTGGGIAVEHRARLFQPFQRAGQETGPIEGTGIGLAISKRLAELMGGRVGFESTLGVGSSFWVELPEARVRPRAVPTPPPPRPALSVRPALVVYVEDNPASVAFLRSALETVEGVAFLHAANAEDGLALIRARRPDLVFMDVNLPGMDGLEALRRLSLDPATRDVPVVAVTAAASATDRARGEQAGFRRYLTKPVSMDELESALEALLPSRR